MNVVRGGAGEPVLVLLHGLGGSAALWQGLTALLPECWPGSWVVPDLPGHGRSEPLPRYSFGALAGSVAAVLEPGRRCAVLGHSLGGAVGLTLASGWFGVSVSAVCGLGVKVRWTAEELGKAAELAARAARAARVLATRAEAADRALRVAGLSGVVPVDSPATDTMLAEVADGWRLALDPGTFGVGAPDLPGLLAACRARVTLAAGEHDPMSPRAHLAALVTDPVTLPGLGHNAHVEDPAALLTLLDRFHG